MKNLLDPFFQSALEYATPDVIAEEFNEGIIILNMKTGMYYDVGGRLVPFLRYLNEGISVRALLESLQAVNPEACDHAIEVLGELQAHGLLRTRDVVTQSAKPQCVQQILGAGDTFTFSINDDLAELIIADPIHDIDPETGKITG